MSGGSGQAILKPGAKNRLLGRGLYTVAKITEATGRYQSEGTELLVEAMASDRPLILTSWHGMTMMLAGFLMSRIDLGKLVLLMPDDWRGETLQVWATLLGTQPFPMNLQGDQTMSSARQLVRLLKILRRGNNCFMSPDGPDGPSQVIKPGVAFLAEKSKAIVIPSAGYARHGYRLNRWDRYVVPYPYSRMSVVFGQPVDMGDSSRRDENIAKLRSALDRVTLHAAANYYEQPR